MDVLKALLELYEACVERAKQWLQPRAQAGLQRVRWTFVTKDELWGKLLGEHPELHDMAEPSTVDAVVDPSGDVVVFPTPNGGVTVLLALDEEKANDLLEKWSTYTTVQDAITEAEEAGDEYEDEEACERSDDAQQGLEDWLHNLLEHIEEALEDDTWESDE